MSKSYDMLVNIDTLSEIESKLKMIKENLLLSVNEMEDALYFCNAFLGGNQYEKAFEITKTSINAAERTSDNIYKAEKYIKELENLVEEYGKCGFWG